MSNAYKPPPSNFASLLSRLPEQLNGDGARLDGGAAQGPDRSYNSLSAPPGMGSAPVKSRESGSEITFGFKHPVWDTIEQWVQVEPETGMFSVGLGGPKTFSFQILAYKVPYNMALWLYDYEFWVNRFSGIDAGQIMRAEDGRFSDIIGFDVNVNGTRRISTLRYVLDPQAIGLERPLFTTGRGETQGQATARSFAAGSGVGVSLLPLRTEVQGARGEPFTWVVDQGDNVVLSATVFRRFTTPIHSIGGRFGGYLLHSNASQALIERSKPQ